ncbi:MAG TPA: hypothetical protein VFY84_19780 [Jiangellales bacterium]|nr:hypothetical protein [Jiangellales bacterium]
MDELTRERYPDTAPADLAAERSDWHWRNKPATNTAAQIAQRRRDLWRALYGHDDREAA